MDESLFAAGATPTSRASRVVELPGMRAGSLTVKSWSRQFGKSAAQVAALADMPGVIVCPADRLSELRLALPGRDIRVDPDLRGVVTVYEDVADVPAGVVKGAEEDTNG